MANDKAQPIAGIMKFTVRCDIPEDTAHDELDHPAYEEWDRIADDVNDFVRQRISESKYYNKASVKADV